MFLSTTTAAVLPDLHRLERALEARDLEAQRPANLSAGPPAPAQNESNLFGICAIQHGYYGNITQAHAIPRQSSAMRLRRISQIVDKRSSRSPERSMNDFMLCLDDRAFDRKRRVNPKLRTRNSTYSALDDRTWPDRESDLGFFVQNWNFSRKPSAHGIRLLRRPRSIKWSPVSFHMTSTRGMLPNSNPSKQDRQLRFSLPVGSEQHRLNTTRHQRSKSLPTWLRRVSARSGLRHKLRESFPWRIPTMEFERGEHLLQSCATELRIMSPSPTNMVSLDGHEELCDDGEDLWHLIQNRLSMQTIGAESQRRTMSTLDGLYGKYQSGFSGELLLILPSSPPLKTKFDLLLLPEVWPCLHRS